MIYSEKLRKGIISMIGDNGEKQSRSTVRDRGEKGIRKRI
jgi:hypothetical protein